MKITTLFSQTTGKPRVRHGNLNGWVPGNVCSVFITVWCYHAATKPSNFCSPAAAKNPVLRSLKQESIPSLLRLRYKGLATCISITFPYSASEYAHSIKLYIHTIRSPPPKHVSLFIGSVFVPRVSVRKWKHRHNGMQREKKRRFMLCPRYTESRRDRNKFIAFDSSAELLLYSHSMFPNWTVLYCYKRCDDNQELH